MKKLLLATVILSQMALAMDSKAEAFETMVAKADEATKGITPQLTFDHEDAKAFAQAVMADVKDNKASAVIRLLRRYEYDSPSWQITAKTVSYNPYGGAVPTPEGRKTLESIFTATIKPGEHWLYYSPPRGWTSPFSLRWHLASWMTKNAYQISDMADKDLLGQDPAAWLLKHGIEKTDGNSASLKEDVKPHIEPAPPIPVQRPDPMIPPQAALPLVKAVPAIPAKPSPEPVSSQPKEKLPSFSFWLAAGAVVLAVLGWVALKKRRAA